MTTIACNLTEMAADTKVSYEGVGTDTYAGMKIFAIHGAIYGTQGESCVGQMHALEWLKEGAIPQNRPNPPQGASWALLELSRNGIFLWNEWLEREQIMNPFIAVGSGRKVALYCMKVMGMSPAEAVNEAAKMDEWSAPPVYVASLKRPTVRKWIPTKRKAKR